MVGYICLEEEEFWENTAALGLVVMFLSGIILVS